MHVVPDPVQQCDIEIDAGHGRELTQVEVFTGEYADAVKPALQVAERSLDVQQLGAVQYRAGQRQGRSGEGEALRKQQAEQLAVTAVAVRMVLTHVDESLGDRQSTRLNSSHVAISYAVFCL